MTERQEHELSMAVADYLYTRRAWQVSVDKGRRVVADVLYHQLPKLAGDVARLAGPGRYLRLDGITLRTVEGVDGVELVDAIPRHHLGRVDQLRRVDSYPTLQPARPPADPVADVLADFGDQLLRFSADRPANLPRRFPLFEGGRR